MKTTENLKLIFIHFKNTAKQTKYDNKKGFNKQKFSANSNNNSKTKSTGKQLVKYHKLQGKPNFQKQNEVEGIKS